MGPHASRTGTTRSICQHRKGHHLCALNRHTLRREGAISPSARTKGLPTRKHRSPVS
ncbi:hypothetical protein ACFFX0_18515 [Citricoccus parietis]|uniref:Uncharacterized protein n=1 Tax=Citricoccus parietis TaxID=592307 RepID=A0ABV5G2C5_9MICC